MQAPADTLKRELEYIRASLLGKYRLWLALLLLMLGTLAWVCALSHLGGDLLDGAHVQGKVISNNPDAQPILGGGSAPTLPSVVTPNSPSISQSGAELLLKIAPVLCCAPIEFEQGGAILTEKSKSLLSEIVPLFAEHPSATLYIDGHTDSDGSPNANKILSLARANATRDYLLSKGVNVAQLQARGFGADQPLADNNTADGRRRNHRIEFRL